MITHTLKPQVPPASRRACVAQPLPDRALSEAEVTDFMARDAKTIETCDQRRSAAVAAIDGA